MTTPSLTRRMSATASVQQPAYAGGAAGTAFTISCAPPVSVSAKTADKFKMATTFSMFETITEINAAIKTSQTLTVNGETYTIEKIGDYNIGNSPVLQLILKAQE